MHCTIKTLYSPKFRCKLTTDDTIRFKCPNCGATARGHRRTLDRDVACPKCKVTVRFEALRPESAGNTYKTVPQSDEPKRRPLPPAIPVPLFDDRRDGDYEMVPAIRTPTTAGGGQLRQMSHRLDVSQIACAWIAAAGFLFLCISPFLRWINIGAGGFIGISGDGQYLLGAAIVASVLFGVSILNRPLLTVPLMISQGVGTLATVWMGGLFWRLSNTFNSANENPFGPLFASLLVSPGAGLYCGLLGGTLVAGSSGYLVLRQPRLGAVPAFFNQILFTCLGIVLIVYLGRNEDLRQQSVGEKVDPYGTKSGAPSFPFLPAPQDSMTEWKQKHKVTEEQWDKLLANYKARMFPKDVSREDWWELAKSRAPAQLNAAFPPLMPREWYAATWIDGFSSSRELDSQYDSSRRERTYALTLKIRLRTPPNVPIREVHGNMSFLKDGKQLFTQAIAEVPDVSFTDSLLVWLKISPYDDSNAGHRDLRYTEDSKLTPIFNVSRVVFADDTEQKFE